MVLDRALGPIQPFGDRTVGQAPGQGLPDLPLAPGEPHRVAAGGTVGAARQVTHTQLAQGAPRLPGQAPGSQAVQQGQRLAQAGLAAVHQRQRLLPRAA